MPVEYLSSMFDVPVYILIPLVNVMKFMINRVFANKLRQTKNHRQLKLN